MSELIHETDFSRRRVFNIIVWILMGFMLLFGIPIGLLLFAAAILSIFSFSEEGMGDIVLTCGFSLIFLVAVPYAVLAMSRILKQHQIKIYDDHVEFSYSPGLAPWKISWRRCDKDGCPYYMLDKNSVSMVDTELNYTNVTVHSNKEANRKKIRKAGGHLKNMGYRRITMDEWIKMRKVRDSEDDPKEENSI